MREALTTAGATAQLLEQGASRPADLKSFLEQPLNPKLPVERGLAEQAAAGDSSVMNYISPDDAAAARARRLSVLVAKVLTGNESESGSGYNTAFMVYAIVDELLALAARALGLPVHLGRNQQDTSSATGRPAVLEQCVCTLL